MSQLIKFTGLLQTGLMIVMIFGLSTESAAQFSSQIIYPENDRLTYLSDDEHNRIPDFSHAGYRGGGVPLPNLPVKITLSPVSGDNSHQIQQAINEIGHLSPDENGFRGAILLNPGIYQIHHSINIDKSGVVLRGSGSGDDYTENSILTVLPSVLDTALQLGNETMSWGRAIEGTQTDIITHFVPVGARLIEVEDASVYQVGDHIVIQHPSTQKWIDAVDGGGTEGAPPWQPGSVDIFYYRMISGIHENIIALDVPVFNHLDRTLSQSVIYKPDNSHLITEVGVENLSIVIQSTGLQSDSHTSNGIYFRGVKNGWAKNVAVLHFSHTGIGTHTSSHITIANSKSIEPHSRVTGGRRYNFNADLFSNNILFTGVSSTDGRRSFIANGMSTCSGIVFHNGRSVRTLGSSEGHQKWTQGILFDSITFEDPQHYNVLSLHNRGDLGSSHGWSAAHSVAWNIDAGENHIFIQKPPTAQNYGIGNLGRVSGQGLFEHPVGYIDGNHMTPDPLSLYDSQLKERLRYGIPPDVPIEVLVSIDILNEITISWSHLSLDENEIILERSDDGGDSFFQIAVITHDTTFTDINLTEKEYHYRLKAFNGVLYSAYTKAHRVSPVLSIENSPDFYLKQPEDGAVFTIYDDPNARILFSWEEVETDKNVDFTYSWFLDEPGGDFTDPIIRIDSLISNSAELKFNVMGDIMRRSGFKVGEQFDGEWKVTATSKTQEKWSSGRKLVSFQKGAKFLPEELSKKLFDIELEQNFPNPFNPATTIRYHLGKPGYVRLEVFDLRGTRVAEIDKGEKPRGTYRIEFNANNLASGIYIYRISTGRSVEIGKMMLLK